MEHKTHVEHLKQKAKDLEEGRISPFRTRIVEHYFDSLNDTVKGINLLLQKLVEEEKLEKEILAVYKQLEEFYTERLTIHKNKGDL